MTEVIDKPEIKEETQQEEEVEITLFNSILEEESKASGHNIFFISSIEGSDENEGTAEQPFKTINHAIKEAQKKYDLDKSVVSYLYLYEGVYMEEQFINGTTLGRIHIIGIDEDYNKVVISNVLIGQPLGCNEHEYLSLQNLTILNNDVPLSHGVCLDYNTKIKTKLTLINCHLKSECEAPLILVRSENNESTLYLIDCFLESESDEFVIEIEKGNLIGCNNEIHIKGEGKPILLHQKGTVQDFRGNRIEPKHRDLITFKMTNNNLN